MRSLRDLYIQVVVLFLLFTCQILINTLSRGLGNEKKKLGPGSIFFVKGL